MPQEEESRAVLAFNRSSTDRPSRTEPPAAEASRVPTVEDVLRRIYDVHAPQLYRFIYHKVGNRQDAEDLTAQVFMKATQSLNVEQDEQSQLAWLYQVARTTIADHWRVYYKGSVVSLDEMQDANGFQEFAESPVLAVPPPEPEDPAVQKVETILSRLPENYRQVLTYRFLHGYSLKETAAAMNISEGNVKVLQYRALQKAGNISTPRGAA
jgi:RNA polymerase sigma-70 factor (ECF subfamily)